MTCRYIGSGPYCYANCMAMILADGTDPGLLEVLTGSPFGLQLIGGQALFDPPGWDPGIGIDAALDLLGWTCEHSNSADADTALERLRAAVTAGPVLAGPVEMGLLGHHPGARGPIGADHYLLVLAADGDLVCFHDPHGHPYATLPAGAFAAAWRGDSIPYARAEYTMRTRFRRTREVGPLGALARPCLQPSPGCTASLSRRPREHSDQATRPWPWLTWPRRAWPAASTDTWRGLPSASEPAASQTPSTGSARSGWKRRRRSPALRPGWLAHSSTR
jgi:hypothetical protein